MGVRGGFTQRLRRAVSSILLVAALCVTFVVCTLTALQITLRNREVPVPRVNGLTPEEANPLLAEAGLTMQIEPVRRVHPTIAPGRIAEQHPGGGVTTRRRRSVRIWLSSGTTPSTLPTLIGASEQAALRHLRDNAFTLDDLAEIRSPRYPVDAVVAQYAPPDGGGQQVSLLVNRGERGLTYVMPDLIGVNQATASDVLRTQGFRVTVVSTHFYPGVPPGVVLRQSPESGFQIAPGEAISLEISQ